MKYRKLGKSGIDVPVISIGCWSFGGGGYWGAQEQSDVDTVVDRAMYEGCNLFDTAELYNAGESERALGNALKNKRHDALICSKVSPDNGYYDTLISHCDGSLKRLGTDYLDIYMLHWPINYRAVLHFTTDEKILSDLPKIEETMAAMEELKRRGKIRAIGISNFGTVQMKEALKTGVQIDVNEMAYNIFSRAIEKDIVPFCMDNSISVFGFMALMQGLLTGKYLSPDQVPMNQAHSRHYAEIRGHGTSRHGGKGAEKEMFDALEELKVIASECGTTLPRLAIAWTLNKPGITSSLVGCRNLQQLEENIRAVSLGLSEETVRRIDDISRPVLDVLGFSPDYYESVENSRIY